MSQEEKIDRLNREFAAADLAGRIKIIQENTDNTVFTTSLGMEDQVITWALSETRSSIHIATLQTGRLFKETIDLIETTRQTYGLDIEEVTPNQTAVDKYVEDKGMFGFYESIAARKECCFIRKIEPLTRTLKPADGWVTGLRREQSAAREDAPFVEWDEQHQVLKFNPLADWTMDQVRETVAVHGIPVNPLHDRSYPSIGCEPCTRAIKPGEPDRAGRWWWEVNETQECGLHEPATAA